MPRRKTPPPTPDPANLPSGTVVAIYARDSGGVEQERSVQDQLAELGKKISRRQWQVPAELIFSDEAMSGTDPGRKGLRDLLDALKLCPCPFKAILL